MEEEEYDAHGAAAVEIAEEDAAVFAPRSSLARTPPTSFSTPCGTPRPVPSKRTLPSPDEQQAAARRCITTRPSLAPATVSAPAAATARMEWPLLGSGPQTAALPTLAPPTTPITPIPTGLITAGTEELAELATFATNGIMEAVRARTSKLNKDELAAIGQHVNSVGSVVTHLLVRLAAAEQRAAIAEERARARPAAPTSAGGVGMTCAGAQRAITTQSYAGAIKLGRGAEPLPIPTRLGPAVAVFPAESQREAVKTADETKKILQSAVKPAVLGIRVQGVRKTGGAGLIVETSSAADAAKLKAALPTTLRTAEPKERRPLVALVGVDADLAPGEMLKLIQEQNFPETTTDELKKSLKTLFNRTRRGNRRMWVCEASPALRKLLVEEKGKIYIGWDVVEVIDFCGVTCCRRCQMYGHPEKYCRTKQMTCGKCGEDGHKNEECQALVTKCATCSKLGRRGATDHRTNARECPARRHAEQRTLNNTNYGQ